MTDSRFTVRNLASHELDEARDLVAAIFSDHSLTLKRRGSTLDYTHRHIQLDTCSFNFISYGPRVCINAKGLDANVMVQLTLSGYDYFRLGKREVLSTPEVATISGVDEPFAMCLSENCLKLAILLDRAELERHAAGMIGAPLRRPLEFQHVMDTGSRGGFVWMQTVQQIMADSGQGLASLLSFPLVRAQFEQMLFSGLLAWQPNTAIEQLQSMRGPTPDARPRHVRIADDYMRAHLDAPLTVEKLAEEAQVSVRLLYDGFARFLCTTPMRHLRALRLERVRMELLDPTQPHNVTSVALRWGFSQLGRFAAAYHRQYGELPSETLRRTRA
ncbi:AraC family transcriptional regulator [Paraburkholderia flagellata]|uniref:AraC family transcriptional regulator n=1 Tax=Paraburkholderia flagellata TaxID=2883241 RepID=UPI001F203ACA|nr:AraC family transcriptional regulator [Paraburkholderia flagellata]